MAAVSLAVEKGKEWMNANTKGWRQRVPPPVSRTASLVPKWFPTLTERLIQRSRPYFPSEAHAQRESFLKYNQWISYCLDTCITLPDHACQKCPSVIPLVGNLSSLEDYLDSGPMRDTFPPVVASLCPGDCLES